VRFRTALIEKIESESDGASSSRSPVAHAESVGTTRFFHVSARIGSALTLVLAARHVKRIVFGSGRRRNVSVHCPGPFE
jgi:hypothetical protein